MNRGGKFFLAAVLTVAMVVPARGSDPGSDEVEARKCKAIPNLLIAIQSDNEGLRESATYLLGEFKCEKAVLPLMSILRGSESESSRIVAALALCRIGDSRGVYAVKRAALFDDSPEVQNRCAWFYNAYVKEGTFAFLPSEDTSPQVAQR
ncbi:MAG: HEAT repeat domain-containing protein [Bacteroidetes bacterium]|nr:HEAT repeat domain-containing protein [Bacteroidota bacterium]